MTCAACPTGSFSNASGESLCPCIIDKCFICRPDLSLLTACVEGAMFACFSPSGLTVCSWLFSAGSSACMPCGAGEYTTSSGGSAMHCTSHVSRSTPDRRCRAPLADTSSKLSSADRFVKDGASESHNRLMIHHAPSRKRLVRLVSGWVLPQSINRYHHRIYILEGTSIMTCA